MTSPTCPYGHADKESEPGRPELHGSDRMYDDEITVDGHGGQRQTCRLQRHLVERYTKELHLAW